MDVVNTFKTVAEDYDFIKGKYKIGDERFEDGIKFVMAISSGSSKVDAFMEVYGETNKHLARVKANQLVHTKWMSELISRIQVGTNVIFHDKFYSALNAMYDLGMTAGSEKVRVEALKGFCDLVKMPDKKTDAPININIGSDMLDRLSEQLSTLASNAKVMLKSGEIVDAEVLNVSISK
jgi:hypothetical protein